MDKSRENGARLLQSVDFSGRPLAHVHPGQVRVSAEPQAFMTIVGSCVTVCVYDPVRRAGGLNHFLLPRRPGGAQSPRFGEGAMQELFERITGLGAVRERLLAKVFGGACLLRSRQARGRHLGDDNVDLAFSVLAAARIPVVSEDVCGTCGRKVIFHADTGDAWVRRL